MEKFWGTIRKYGRGKNKGKKEDNKEDLPPVRASTKKKIAEIKSLLWEVSFYAIFLILLVSTAFNSRDQRAFGYRDGILRVIDKKHSVYKAPLTSLISTPDNMWNWTEKALIPFLYSTVDWRGDPIHYNSMLISNLASYRLGPIRFRQHRVRNDFCQTQSEFSQTGIRCVASWSYNDRDLQDYGPGWTKLEPDESGDCIYDYEYWKNYFQGQAELKPGDTELTGDSSERDQEDNEPDRTQPTPVTKESTTGGSREQTSEYRPRSTVSTTRVFSQLDRNNGTGGMERVTRRFSERNLNKGTNVMESTARVFSDYLDSQTGWTKSTAEGSSEKVRAYSLDQTKSTTDESGERLNLTKSKHGATKQRARRSRERDQEYEPVWEDVKAYDGESTDQMTEADGQRLNTTLLSSAWRYSTWSDIGGLPVTSALGIYPPGGYVLDAVGSIDEVLVKLAYLKENRWVDHLTKVVLVEVTLYNPNANLFAMLSAIFEFPQAHVIMCNVHIHVCRLFSYLGDYPVIQIICDCLVYLAILWFVVRESLKIYEQRFQYFKEVWNLLKLVNVLISLVACALYVGLQVVTNQFSKEANKSSGQFYNFQTLALWDELFGYLVGFVCFLSTLQILHLLRFNKRMSILGATMMRSAHDLSSFALVFVLVFIAFASFSYFMFGAMLTGYRSVIDTVESLITVALGAMEYKQLSGANRVFAPLFIFLYMMFIVFILINMLITIIMDSFAVVREDVNKVPTDYELINYMMYRVTFTLWKFRPVRVLWSALHKVKIVSHRKPESLKKPKPKQSLAAQTESHRSRYRKSSRAQSQPDALNLPSGPKDRYHAKYLFNMLTLHVRLDDVQGKLDSLWRLGKMGSYTPDEDDRTGTFSKLGVPKLRKGRHAPLSKLNSLGIDPRKGKISKLGSTKFVYDVPESKANILSANKKGRNIPNVKNPGLKLGHGKLDDASHTVRAKRNDPHPHKSPANEKGSHGSTQPAESKYRGFSIKEATLLDTPGNEIYDEKGKKRDLKSQTSPLDTSDTFITEYDDTMIASPVEHVVPQTRKSFRPSVTFYETSPTTGVVPAISEGKSDLRKQSLASQIDVIDEIDDYGRKNRVIRPGEDIQIHNVDSYYEETGDSNLTLNMMGSEDSYLYNELSDQTNVNQTSL